MPSLTYDLSSYLPSALQPSVRSETNSGTTTSRLIPSLCPWVVPVRATGSGLGRQSRKGVGAWKSLSGWVHSVNTERLWSGDTWKRSACGVAGPSSICLHPSATHMRTLTADLCIYALRRRGSKGYGWRGLGTSRQRRIGCWEVGAAYRWQKLLKGERGKGGGLRDIWKAMKLPFDWLF